VTHGVPMFTNRDRWCCDKPPPRSVPAKPDVRHSNAVPRRLSILTITSVILWIGTETLAHGHGSALQAAAHRSVHTGTTNAAHSKAKRTSARAQALLGFRYEHGLGEPQVYDIAVDLYARAAARGDSFGQNRLGLMYDKGHGVPKDPVLSYKWLSLAAARASRSERDFYLRLRDAVASKMSADQIIEGQYLTSNWRPRLR
jgi:hypothetical protein